MTTIIITTRVVGFHQWDEAPHETAYLAKKHRHLFEVRVEKRVNGSNRETEFHALKRKTHEALLARFTHNAYGEFEFGGMSCEMIATSLMLALEASAVEVWEDEECGARVEA